MASIFKNNETQKVFDEWIQPFNGINPHPLDDERFYAFVRKYYLNNEAVSREVFSKEARKYTHTTRTINRGICQKYYDRMISIIGFIKAMKIQL